MASDCSLDPQGPVAHWNAPHTWRFLRLRLREPLTKLGVKRGHLSKNLKRFGIISS